MFNKNMFAEVLQEIILQYDSISNFAEKASLDRTYISKYLNKKLEHPPSPDVLKKISRYSNNIINYIELMLMCDYLSDKDCECLKNIKSTYHLYLVQYNNLNKFGQKKVNDYINDLIDTNKYNN